MKKWFVTGVSGSERIEILNELAAYCMGKGKNVLVHDVGDIIKNECSKHRIHLVDQRVLDMDRTQLEILRAAALKEVQIRILRESNVDLHLIGIHATFRWRSRLMSGISYQDIVELKPDGFINVVRDVKEVVEANRKNPKWSEDGPPNLKETQEWMMEEEFVTEVLAEVNRKPIFLIARKHPIDNIADLFFTNKKKIYLSYPITAVRESSQDLLDRIQGPILDELKKLFVVFNPLDITDMRLTYKEAKTTMPELVSDIDHKAIELIKKRTIERDFQFIDQSDAVVVFYLTEKVSPGVLAEIYYAHRNQKPVFMVLPHGKSPFVEDAVTKITDSIEEIMQNLHEFSRTKSSNGA